VNINYHRSAGKASGRLLRLGVLILIFLGFPFCHAALPDDTFASALDERMSGLLAKYGVPGAVVSCINNGEVAWTKAYGRANLETGAPMESGMVFNHGSNGKVLTMWAIMRLVEQGKIELDSPANRYLKRWQIRSSQFDPSGVTIRRLLSHRAGLSPWGFTDYDQRRRLPTLVEVVEGKNQITLFGGAVNGPVFIKWQPGSTNVYSGGGYVILQMIIEDVTGESFAGFMEHEVATPLGLKRLDWVWKRELEKMAPIPYGEMQEEIGYRQLACQSIGSEICSVPDYARFVAALIPGPKGEPPGRGVLKPETVATMTDPSSDGVGFGFSITNMTSQLLPVNIRNERFVEHSGQNFGWTAYFLLDTTKHAGFVVANNSLLGLDFNLAIERIWLTTVLGMDAGTDPPPRSTMTVSINHKFEEVAIVIWLFLLAAAGRCAFQIARGRRRACRVRLKRSLLLVAPPLLLLLIWWYLFYAPQSLALPLPTTFLSVWRLPLINYVMAVLVGWLSVAFLFTLYPQTPGIVKPMLLPNPGAAS
jgi:CubicO group peptidase (beta-lactamase class C family)